MPSPPRMATTAVTIPMAVLPFATNHSEPTIIASWKQPADTKGTGLTGSSVSRRINGFTLRPNPSVPGPKSPRLVWCGGLISARGGRRHARFYWRQPRRDDRPNGSIAWEEPPITDRPNDPPRSREPIAWPMQPEAPRQTGTAPPRLAGPLQDRTCDVRLPQEAMTGLLLRITPRGSRSTLILRKRSSRPAS